MPANIDRDTGQKGAIMVTCTFFGHRTVPQEINDKLHSLLVELIEQKNVSRFYVGNQGEFDTIARKQLEELKEQYPFIEYRIVLAYMPGKKTPFSLDDTKNTIYPEGLEQAPLRYAISRRNRWMIENTDFVVTYVASSFGCSAGWKELAEKKGKTVYNLAE